MGFRYFITFLDIVMCLIILFFTRACKSKSNAIGVLVMFLSYALSAVLMWI